MKKNVLFLALWMLAFRAWPQQTELTIPGPRGPSVVPGSGELSRSYRRFSLGMDLDALKQALSVDPFFDFRGDPDVSFLPAREENLVETSGASFIRRAFFQLKEGMVFIMAFHLDPHKADYYSVFTAFVAKYGEPVQVNPAMALWENGETRVSIERPLTVKYIDMNTFRELVEESGAEEAAEMYMRRAFLDEF